MIANKPTDAASADSGEQGNRSASVGARLDEFTTPVKRKFEAQIGRASAAVIWANRFRLYRVGKRFTTRDGNLLAAGMSYRAMFAIFAALWLGFSVAGFWLVGNPTLTDAIIDIIDRAVPGLIGPNGLISGPALFEISGTLGWTGVAAAIGLLWTATSWLNATRLAVRAMFGLARVKVNIVAARVSDFVLALAFGIVLIAAAVLSVASASILTTLLTWIGIVSESFWTEAAGSATSFLVVCALNILVLAVMYRVLSRVAIPFRALLVGATLGGVSLSVLSTLSGLVLGGTTSNPLLASFAVFFGLLIWFNLVCRIILLAASWIAVGMSDRGISPRRLSDEQREIERAEEEHRARVLVAEADLAQARVAYEASRGIRRMMARRRLLAAQEHLAATTVDAHDFLGH